MCHAPGKSCRGFVLTRLCDRCSNVENVERNDLQHFPEAKLLKQFFFKVAVWILMQKNESIFIKRQYCRHFYILV